MKKYAVIGHPIAHSLSPLMHNTTFQHFKIDGNYEALDIEPASLEQAIGRFRKEMWSGFNVTAPHKEAVIPLIDEVVPEARAVGAVNTIVNRHNTFVGYNTDVLGVERSIHPYRTKIEGRSCVILGSGGAARSVVHVLTHKIKPLEITFSAQFLDQAHALIKSVGDSNVKFNVIHYTDKALEAAIKNCTLIVNATTAGMFPAVLDSPLPNRNWLSKQHIVFDLVYRPLITRLLNDARTVGAKSIDGLEMFLQQGAAAFQLWTGKEMPVEHIRQVLEDKLAK
jgi:shikimate dehydrogenase